MLDTYTVVAEPTRRRILDLLLKSDSSVTELARNLEISQPLLSKHLRTLRDSGLVQVRVDAQRRIYSLDPRPLEELDDWLDAYRAKWNKHVDALARHLEERKKPQEEW
jgi:DNA-binding transcriptional ArsR family regulator